MVLAGIEGFDPTADQGFYPSFFHVRIQVDP
jgi:hypothetical protein